jgi:hypothetical protein
VTRTFTTPRFQTAFDRVLEPLALPGELRSGAAPELTVVDQLIRGNAVIGRFVAAAGLFGLKVRPTGRPVRVTALLRFDSTSLEWWEKRVTTTTSPWSAPRLLVVRSQGKTRGATLLIRPAAGSRRPATGVVCFDLQPDELTAEGLLILEVVSVESGRPDWAPALPAGSIGVGVDAIEFTEAEGDRELGLVSTGTLPPDPEDTTLTLGAGYFVANPSDSDQPRHWIARATLVDPVLPGPETKVAPVVDPVDEPIEIRPRTSQGLNRRVKRGVRRAARWVVPVAAVPAIRRARRRTVALERRFLRAGRRIPARAAFRVHPGLSPSGRPFRPSLDPLADVMFDLVDRNLVQVELAGVEGGPTPGVQVRARGGAEIEIITDGPLTVPALVRLSIDPSSLRGVPGVDDQTVSWELVGQTGF